MLADYIRVFSCESAHPFLVGGLLASALVGFAWSRVQPLDTYIDRARFGVCMGAGVLVGGLIFFLLHDGCVPRW